MTRGDRLAYIGATLYDVTSCHGYSGVGTYLSGTARAVPLLKVGRLVMHFAVPLFGHRLHIALMKVT